MKVYRDLEKAKKDGYTKFVKSSKYEPCYQYLVSEAIPTGIVYKKVSIYKRPDSEDTAKVITWAAANNSADIWLEKLTKANSHTISDVQLDVIYKAARDKYYAEATDKVTNALANFNPDMFVSMEAFEKWLEKTKKVTATMITLMSMKKRSQKIQMLLVSGTKFGLSVMMQRTAAPI